jgi:branched-chain amino acid transport system substrate-binding protein
MVFKTGICALATALAMASGAMAETTIKVGVILTYSGTEAQAGELIDKGLRLYVKTHEKELPPGVKVELVIRDDTGPKADVAKRLAQELITREHVQFLTGVVWTPNALAIAPLTAEAKVPFVVMNAAGVTLTRTSPYIVRVSYTLPQLATPLGEWTVKQGWKTAYTAVPDFSPGHEAETAFAKAFTGAGGEMLGSVRFPLISPEFAPFFARIKDAKPEVLYIFSVAGKQSTAIMKTMTDLGMRTAGIRPVSGVDLTTDEELPNMGEQALGIISASHYSASATRPANQAFIAQWKQEYRDVIPNFFSIGGWDGMNAIYDVIKQTGGTFTGDQAMAILSHWKNPNSPRGPIEINPQTRDVIQNIYIRRVEKQNGQYVNVEFDTIPMVKDPWQEQNPIK